LQSIISAITSIFATATVTATATAAAATGIGIVGATSFRDADDKSVSGTRGTGAIFAIALQFILLSPLMLLLLLLLTLLSLLPKGNTSWWVGALDISDAIYPFCSYSCKVFATLLTIMLKLLMIFTIDEEKAVEAVMVISNGSLTILDSSSRDNT
jgi:hypothetical protein